MVAKSLFIGLWRALDRRISISLYRLEIREREGVRASTEKVPSIGF